MKHSVQYINPYSLEYSIGLNIQDAKDEFSSGNESDPLAALKSWYSIVYGTVHHTVNSIVYSLVYNVVFTIL